MKNSIVPLLSLKVIKANIDIILEGLGYRWISQQTTSNDLGRIDFDDENPKPSVLVGEPWSEIVKLLNEDLTQSPYWKIENLIFLIGKLKVSTQQLKEFILENELNTRNGINVLMETYQDILNLQSFLKDELNELQIYIK